MSKPSLSLQVEIELLRAQLNDGIEFFEVGGQSVFPVYGASGGLVDAQIFYLVRRVPGADTFRALPVRVPLHYSGDVEWFTEQVVKTAVRQFEEMSHIVRDGDDLGVQGVDFRSGIPTRL